MKQQKSAIVCCTVVGFFELMIVVLSPDNRKCNKDGMRSFTSGTTHWMLTIRNTPLTPTIMNFYSVVWDVWKRLENGEFSLLTLLNKECQSIFFMADRNYIFSLVIFFFYFFFIWRGELHKLACEKWSAVSDDVRHKMARTAASAAWGLGKKVIYICFSVPWKIFWKIFCSGFKFWRW